MSIKERKTNKKANKNNKAKSLIIEGQTVYLFISRNQNKDSSIIYS